MSEQTQPMMEAGVGPPSKVEDERDALVAALQWCSGSGDFAPGGKARKGWLKLCQPLLT